MDFLHDKRIVKSFMASLAINAAGVCLIGGSCIYNVRTEALQPPDTAATLHPVPITVATIPLTPLSTTRPWIKQQSADTTVKRSTKPDKTLPSHPHPKTIAAEQRHRAPKSSSLLSKHDGVKAFTPPPQMALATPQDFQDSGAQSDSPNNKSGLRGAVGDKLFERTLAGLEHGAANGGVRAKGESAQGANGVPAQGAPGKPFGGREGAAAPRPAQNKGSEGDGKLLHQLNGGKPAADIAGAAKNQGEPRSNGGTPGKVEQTSSNSTDGHGDNKSYLHDGGKVSTNGSHSGKVGEPRANRGSDHGPHMTSGKPAGSPLTPVRQASAKTTRATSSGPSGNGQDRYVGQAYRGGSPVNEQIRQPAALNPGNDLGTAVDALHLPKAADGFAGQPGPKQTAGPARSLQDKGDKTGFEILPTDLGSTSIFGQVPWGRPRPSMYQDPDAGKDGMGLLGSYYVGKDFDQLVFQRPDSNINFIWTGVGPGPQMPTRQPFTVRWTGALVAAYTEPYTIMTASDDGVRVYLNDNLIIDNWTVHAVTEDTATVNLVANQPNDIKVEYFEKNGMSNEIIKLYWESKDTPLEYIPENALIYPQAN